MRKSHAKFTLATINVEILVGKSAKVTKTVGKRRVDAATLQEVCYRNEEVKTLKGGEFEYKLYWKDENTVYKGVG